MQNQKFADFNFISSASTTSCPKCRKDDTDAGVSLTPAIAGGYAIVQYRGEETQEAHNSRSPKLPDHLEVIHLLTCHSPTAEDIGTSSIRQGPNAGLQLDSNGDSEGVTTSQIGEDANFQVCWIHKPRKMLGEPCRQDWKT